MTDLSPMERARRALAVGIHYAECCPGTEWGHARRWKAAAGQAVRALAELRTSDPEAFGAVLAEYGVTVYPSEDAVEALGDALNDNTVGGTEGWDPDGVASELADRGYHLVSEGQAVIEGRVVELERHGVRCANGTHVGPCAHEDMVYALVRGGEWLYRVKPERSDRHTEDAS